MAGRYLVTGVQLGMLKALAKNEPEKVEEDILAIQDKQYVGNSRNEISDDVITMREGKLPLFTSR